MSPEFIIVISGMIASFGSILIALMTNRTAATKAQFESLQSTIAILQSENKRLLDRLKLLECERKDNESRIEILEEQVRQLEEQVRTLGAIPVTRKDEKK